MTIQGDYTRPYDVRNLYLSSSGSSDDGLILGICQQVSREIDDLTNRRFYPRIETRYYDYQNAFRLTLDDDLLDLTTLTNGDSTTIAAASYKLYPLNATPKTAIQLLTTEDNWALPTSGEPYGAITVNGVWGYHPRYTDAWRTSGAVLTAALSDASTVTLSCTASVVQTGDLLKLGSEYLYATAITSGSSNNVTVERGVNGTTAASALIGATLYKWTVSPEISNLATRAAAGYYKLRQNPMQETIVVDGTVFQTPKDVNAYLRKNLENMSGLHRLGFA
jgi:hypothetical protein